MQANDRNIHDNTARRISNTQDYYFHYEETEEDPEEILNKTLDSLYTTDYDDLDELDDIRLLGYY
jgi:hypothetical protein